MEGKEHIEKLETEKYAFLTKCENLSHQIIQIPLRTGSNNPFEKSYIICESVMSTLQEKHNKKQQDQAKETYILLRNQYKNFTEEHNMIAQYALEYVVTT